MKISFKKFLITSITLFSIVSLNSFALTQHKTVRHRNHSMSIQETKVININNADEKQLMTLKGVGEKKAAAIVAYRNEHGNFRKVEDLTNVKGISAKTVKRLQEKNPDRIKVN